MENDKGIISKDAIKSRIYTIRGEQVMLDSDLAEFYQVATKRLNEQVSRNRDRFPDNFMFQLTEDDLDNLKSQTATSSENVLRSQFATSKNKAIRSHIVTLEK